MADDPVLYERRGRVALLTLNRPERLNAWNGPLGRAYFELLQRCGADDEVRAIVVTGAGKGWCAGADMDHLQSIGAGESEGGGGMHRPQSFTTTVPKPVIAAINGACAGLGLVQALFCDLRFAAAGAKFTTAFARRGLVAEHGISWVLPRLVGPARAMDLLLSGRVFLAEEAFTLGVVNAVHPPEQLLAASLAYAEELATFSSPSSMAAMKRQIWTHVDLPLAASERESDELMAASLKADDFREGVQSFVQKRPPEFSPQVASWARA